METRMKRWIVGAAALAGGIAAVLLAGALRDIHTRAIVRSERGPTIEELDALERRVNRLYLVDDLRACQDASTVVCSCVPATAGGKR